MAEVAAADIADIALPCPWHRQAWAALQSRADTLPHALLLSGETGIGKRRFVDAFAAWLLCSAPVDGLACRRCKSCLLFAAGSHPDSVLLIPEAMRADADESDAGGKKRKPSREIRIDEVRALIDFTSRTAQFGGRRVVRIDPAQAMNSNAANALLKTLEEPGAGTILLLVTSTPAMLSATIRSRCQQVKLPAPGRAEALNWLAPLVGGQAKAVALLAAAATPLRALALLDGEDDWPAQRRVLATLLVDVLCGRTSAVRFAEAAGKTTKSAEAENMLMDWLPGLLADAVRLAEGVPPENLRNGDLAHELRRLVEARTTQPLFLLGDDLSQLRRQFHSNTGLNRPLLWEEVLLRWSSRNQSFQN